MLSLTTAPSTVMSPSVCCAWMADPPKIENQMRATMLGARSTPTTNSRMVRPRLMRAMNMPTNGVHEIHQAQ